MNDEKKEDGFSTAKVKRRHVVYISGFDPKGPSHYHNLYRSEAEKQGRVNGMTLDVSARKRLSPTANGWQVKASVDGQEVETDYEFLRWDDIVRKYWPRNELHILRELVFGLWTYFSSGALWRVLRTAWPPFITGLIPSFYVMLVYGMALAAASTGNLILQG